MIRGKLRDQYAIPAAFYLFQVGQFIVSNAGVAWHSLNDKMEDMLCQIELVPG